MDRADARRRSEDVVTTSGATPREGRTSAGPAAPPNTASNPSEFHAEGFDELDETPPPTHGHAAEMDELLRRLSAMSPEDPARIAHRQHLVEAHLPLVHHLAQRFRGRGEPYDDLVQVGTIGLLNAV